MRGRPATRRRPMVRKKVEVIEPKEAKSDAESETSQPPTTSDNKDVEESHVKLRSKRILGSSPVVSPKYPLVPLPNIAHTTDDCLLLANYPKKMGRKKLCLKTTSDVEASGACTPKKGEKGRLFSQNRKNFHLE